MFSKKKRVSEQVKKLLRNKTKNNLADYIIGSRKKKISIFIGFCILLGFIFFGYDYFQVKWSIQKYVELDLVAPVISSPIIVQNKNRDYLALADLSGLVYFYETPSMNLRFSFQSDEKILAPLSKIKMKKDDNQNYLVVYGEKRKIVLDHQGDYLYTNRVENRQLSVLSKPLIFFDHDKEYLMSVDNFGEMSLTETSYGKIIWQEKLKEMEGIIAAISLWKEGDKKYGVILTKSGKVYLIDALSGSIVFELDTKEPIYSSLILGNFINNKSLMGLVTTQKGSIFLIDFKNRKLHSKYKLEQKVVSTPALIKDKNGDKALFFTMNGEVIELKVGGDEQWIKEVLFYHPKWEFRSSPILLDINYDGFYDIIVVSATGDVLLLDIKNRNFLYEGQYHLGAEVTASPLFQVDKKGIGYLWIATEKSRVYGFILKRSRRYKKKDAHREFLYNSLNLGKEYSYGIR